MKLSKDLLTADNWVHISLLKCLVGMKPKDVVIHVTDQNVILYRWTRDRVKVPVNVVVSIDLNTSKVKGKTITIDESEKVLPLGVDVLKGYDFLFQNDFIDGESRTHFADLAKRMKALEETVEAHGKKVETMDKEVGDAFETVGDRVGEFEARTDTVMQELTKIVNMIDTGPMVSMEAVSAVMTDPVSEPDDPFRPVPNADNWVVNIASVMDIMPEKANALVYAGENAKMADSVYHIENRIPIAIFAHALQGACEDLFKYTYSVRLQHYKDDTYRLHLIHLGVEGALGHISIYPGRIGYDRVMNPNLCGLLWAMYDRCKKTAHKLKQGY